MPQTRITYAIGDIHGEASRLRQMHQLILSRHKKQHPGAAIRVVHLGDYVDRGKDSFGVIEAIIELQKSAECEVINLKGNHEQLLLNALETGSERAMKSWLENGGTDTLKSYTKRGFKCVSEDHLSWIAALQTHFLELDTKTMYVHAGIDVEAFPHSSDTVRLWTRSAEFFDVEKWSNPALDGWRIVHGHTPTDDFFPECAGSNNRRINLDTGAVFGGRLTAGIFKKDHPVKFIYA